MVRTGAGVVDGPLLRRDAVSPGEETATTAPEQRANASFIRWRGFLASFVVASAVLAGARIGASGAMDRFMQSMARFVRSRRS